MDVNGVANEFVKAFAMTNSLSLASVVTVSVYVNVFVAWVSKKRSKR